MSATEFMNTVTANAPSDYHIVDVRERNELELVSLGSGLDVVVLPLSEFSEWEGDITNKLDDEKTIFCLCHHGVRSMRMATFLESVGFDDVVNVSGGIHAVATEVDPSIGTY